MDNQGIIPIATKTNVRLIIGVDAPVIANTDEVESGARVNGIFLNVQVAVTSTAALANVYMILYQNAGGNIQTAQIPNGNVTGAADFKPEIFHTEMLMGEKNTTGIPRTLFKGVLKLPRKMHRIGVTDIIELQLFSPGVTWEYCVECIYKEYR